MDQKQLRREDFSYEANTRGYMLKYRGQSIGGAGISSGIFGPNGKKEVRHTQDFADFAETDIQDIMFGNPGHYSTLIDEINNR
ncbi:MAG: hypothetical protein ACTSPB_07350 [Candidatus Thorarchaeota archaeon]